MRDFSLLEPRTPVEASRMLTDLGENGRLLAGGTALLLGMRQRLVTPSHLVYLGGVPGLNGIDYSEREGLRLGPLVRHADLAASPVVAARYPMLAAMAKRIANPQIRNMATLGGNLCYGDPATDPPTCLIALRARATVIGPDGERSIELDDFFTDFFQTALAPGEVLTEVRVPPPASDSVSAYTRHLRTAAEHRPLVGLAVLARTSGGVCRDVRMVVGASTPVPTRLRKAEDLLKDSVITSELCERAADRAATEIDPVSDFRGSADYRRGIVRTVVRRTLKSLLVSTG